MESKYITKVMCSKPYAAIRVSPSNSPAFLKCFFLDITINEMVGNIFSGTLDHCFVFFKKQY